MMVPGVAIWTWVTSTIASSFVSPRKVSTSRRPCQFKLMGLNSYHYAFKKRLSLFGVDCFLPKKEVDEAFDIDAIYLRQFLGNSI